MVKSKPVMHKAGHLFSFVLGVIFVIGGFLATYLKGLPLIEQGKASKNWPTTKGVVLKSKVASHRSSNSNSSTYSAEITYRYQVEGQNYKCGTVWFGSDVSTSNRSLAQDTVKKYPVDKQVVVYYDPQKPAAAVLEPGVFKTTYFYYVFGWLFMGPGILMTGIPLFRWLVRVGRGTDERGENVAGKF
ncbi:DUF3592 domain-containing protein [Gimesia fumaroli]|uniref:DUF3592 domain-containing protein n=1 Tax=Gimesia fumaroli TaxID=2527976 RepID=A0A518I4Z0_9PLAN|nr:DUF3592 domain-containing protein [Gimesia fumaroli]QDV48123.1 hypothetical protein Enr17x_01320 [Gimesia fumaroli]